MHLIIGAVANRRVRSSTTHVIPIRGSAGPMRCPSLVQLAAAIHCPAVEGQIRQDSRSCHLRVERLWSCGSGGSPTSSHRCGSDSGIAEPVLNLARTVVVYLYRPRYARPLFPGNFRRRDSVGNESSLLRRADNADSRGPVTCRRRIRSESGSASIAVSMSAIECWAPGVRPRCRQRGLLEPDIAYQFVVISVIAQLYGLAMVSGQNRDLNTRDFSVYRMSSEIVQRTAMPGSPVADRSPASPAP